ncbi:hypothetical protein [Nonomuraea dietziae]|uniref:hypothetical protein n=1 Tax=Nonomuraea dietziae TaxID=65515 RepID=UPI00342973C3
MPNIKKLAAAIALSTALTGGVLGVGAMTSAAAAGTTTVANGGGDWGWGGHHGHHCAPWEHRLNRTKIRINHHTGHVRYRRVNGCAKIRHAESFLHGGHHGHGHHDW